MNYTITDIKNCIEVIFSHISYKDLFIVFLLLFTAVSAKDILSRLFELIGSLKPSMAGVGPQEPPLMITEDKTPIEDKQEAVKPVTEAKETVLNKEPVYSNNYRKMHGMPLVRKKKR